MYTNRLGISNVISLKNGYIQFKEYLGKINQNSKFWNFLKEKKQTFKQDQFQM